MRMKFLDSQHKSYKLIRNALSQTVVLALLATILVLLVFPLNFPKYKAEILETHKNNQNALHLWDEFDNNGISDHLIACQNPIGTSAVTINLFPSRHVEEWDFRGSFNFYKNHFIITGDYNSDKNKEIYVFTLSNDSIYLHCIIDFFNPQPYFKNKFIAKVGTIYGKSDPEIISAEMADLNDDGFKELIFGISCGFSIYPRGIYTYDVRHDTLLRSPPSGFQVQEIIQTDLTRVHKQMIMLAGYAPGNINDSNFPFNDHSCWLMVLDNKLRFLFNPVEFPGRTGSIFPIKIEQPEGGRDINVLVQSPFKQNTSRRLMKYDLYGKLLLEKKLVEIPINIDVLVPFSVTINKQSIILIPAENGRLYYYDLSYKYLKQVSLEDLDSDVLKLDIDSDGKSEILIPMLGQKKLVIFRSDLSDPAALNISLSDPLRTNLSIKETGTGVPLLFVSTGDINFTISYGRNPMYFANWAFPLGIFFSFLLFILFIKKIQKSQIQKRYLTEKKITELQLKIVRNQMDPHFTMNAINSVMEAINRQEGEEAQQNLLHFSKMYRSLVLSADKIKRTVEEELDFTRNYLELEKFRFIGQFNYSIEISPEVNLKWEIPKMIIQSPVENAVKHGFYGNQQSGLLSIFAYLEDRHLVFKITDNGIGRKQASSQISNGTGKGLQIMEEFLDLYEKITGIKITSRIEDLYSEDGQPAGTSVTILIPVS